MGKAIAIITARGGSKRIPHKNRKLFLGKPIMEYSIQAAKEAGIFSEIMVSTDDKEIAGIAEMAGAKVPFMRSEKASGDFATTAQVIEEVIGQYEARGETFTDACCIYPTAPFVTGEKLRDAMLLLEEKAADAVIPAVRFSFPPQRAVVLKEGKLVPKWQEHMLSRSQDLEPFYHDCGQFYCLHIDSFKKQKKLFMDDTLPLIQSELEVQDIDTEEDWKIAELKYQLLFPKK